MNFETVEGVYKQFIMLKRGLINVQMFNKLTKPFNMFTNLLTNSQTMWRVHKGLTSVLKSFKRFVNFTNSLMSGKIDLYGFNKFMV